MLSAILIFFSLPIINKDKLKSTNLDNLTFILFTTNFLLLMFLGGQATTEPYVTIALISTFFYFFLFRNSNSISK